MRSIFLAATFFALGFVGYPIYDELMRPPIEFVTSDYTSYPTETYDYTSVDYQDYGRSCSNPITLPGYVFCDEDMDIQSLTDELERFRQSLRLQDFYVPEGRDI